MDFYLGNKNTVITSFIDISRSVWVRHLKHEKPLIYSPEIETDCSAPYEMKYTKICVYVDIILTASGNVEITQRLTDKF